MKEKLITIINHYGVKKQLKKFNEESFELIEAIINYEWSESEYGRCKKDNIAEEIADCYVLIEQFRQYYGITNKDIAELMRFKINRTIRRINNENNR